MDSTSTLLSSRAFRSTLGYPCTHVHRRHLQFSFFPCRLHVFLPEHGLHTCLTLLNPLHTRSLQLHGGLHILPPVCGLLKMTQGTMSILRVCALLLRTPFPVVVASRRGGSGCTLSKHSQFDFVRRKSKRRSTGYKEYRKYKATST
jgi:hypothetical protein